MNFMDRSGGSYNVVSGVVLSDLAVAAINAFSINAQLVNSIVLAARDLAFLNELSWQYSLTVPTQYWWRTKGEYYDIAYTSSVVVTGSTGPVPLSYDVGTYRYYKGEYVETISGWLCYKIARRPL
jgi:hypothetical protein